VGDVSEPRRVFLFVSRWVNESLEELLTLAPRGVRPSPALLRDAYGYDDDGEALPPRSAQTPEEIDRFLDELDTDALDLSFRIDVVDAISRELPGDERRAVRQPLASLAGLLSALEDVRRCAADRRVSHFAASDAPLGAYLKGLHARASMMARALERYAAGLREDTPDPAAFAGELAEAASFRFSWLVDSIRRDLGAARLGLGGGAHALRALRHALENLFAATARLDDAFI
jgi:hypothetical protein